MEYSPFLRGFLPGILIGLFSSVLIFSLWRSSILVELPIQRGFHGYPDAAAGAGVNVAADMDAGERHKKKERRSNRDVDGSSRQDQCNSTFYLKTQPIPRRNYLLLLLIDSSPRATAQRNTLRATWLNDYNKEEKFAFKFVVGTANLRRGDMQKLACENQQYGDLLLLADVEDPVKAPEWSPSEKVLGAFLWALDNVEFDYIFKTNDGTSAVLNPIIKELEVREQDSPKTDLLWGFFAGGVQATKEGRFGEKNWFLCTHYLPFPQGGGYVISHGLISMLGELNEDLQHYSHDDIAIGVWLSPFNGIEKKHDVRFNTGYSSRGCNNAYFVISRETPKTMFQRYSYFKKTGLMCEEEYLSRLSYVFNWTASPNRCCIREPGIP